MRCHGSFLEKSCKNTCKQAFSAEKKRCEAINEINKQDAKNVHYTLNTKHSNWSLGMLTD